MFKKNIIKYGNPYPWMPKLALSKSKIPDWYKNSKHPNYKNITSLPDEKILKKCIPFIDAMTFGYMLETPADLAVKIFGDQPVFTWESGNINIVEIRDSSIADNLPIPDGYHETHFIWKKDTVIETPKGYSLFLTHPLNRFDLPFITVSGLVDSDGIFQQGNIPFFLKKGFEGFIPKGTPYAQIIPFKRESWESKEDNSLFKKGEVLNMNCMNSLMYYKNNIWHKKTFE
jgi:hypothetical protein